jgi:hypothetical protein
MKTSDANICIFCDEEVLSKHEHFNLAIDRPVRIDLIVHRKCYQTYRNNGELKAFLQDYLMDYIEKYNGENYGEKKTTYNKSKSKSKRR